MFETSCAVQALQLARGKSSGDALWHACTRQGEGTRCKGACFRYVFLNCLQELLLANNRIDIAAGGLGGADGPGLLALPLLEV